MDTSLLLVVPVPFRVMNHRYGLDHQTCDGLIRWTEQFDRLVMAAPVLPEKETREVATKDTWRAIEDLPCADRIEIVPLPYAYKPIIFVREYSRIRKLLSAKIQECEYLCFEPCVWIGDWAGVACSEAIRLKRSYAVRSDRVEYEVTRRLLKEESLKNQIKERLTLPITKRYVQNLIRKSDVGLFQGQDCYTAFSPLNSNSHCVYDVHTQKFDQIRPERLATKLDRITQNQPLNLCYVGRAVAMKGGLDWIEIIAQLHDRGMRFKATWLGDGDLLDKMKVLAERLGVANLITFGGFVSDRAFMLEMMQQQDVFMFCHKTPESPRCLVEALVSGLPIVGYDSPYPRGLVAQHGGGMFTPLNDQTALAEQILALDRDRASLRELIQHAAESGKLYDEETVFQHRSDLIKKYVVPKSRNAKTAIAAVS
ncbi:glycosyltransferase [Leptolyngbya sp. AN03gr2]|uniref:glycosyltransferase n=1 Tax=unclassified Leptolyngbya TaxID=2650499 RepID=UPI003D31D169